MTTAMEGDGDDISETTPCLSQSTNQGAPLLDSDSLVLSRNSKTRWYGGICCHKFPTTEVAILLYSLYFAAAWPLTEQFIYAEVSKEYNFTKDSSMNCSSANKSSPAYQLENKVQSQSTLYMIYQNVAIMCPSFFVIIFIGGYSDKAGRKYAMIFPCIGALFRCILCTVIIHLELSLTWFYLASVVEGCFGGSSMFLMAAFSHISDYTSEENRSFRIIVLESCLGLGIASSQLCLGYIIEWLGYMWPFAILATLSFVDILYVIFCVQETVIPTEPVPLLSKEHFTGTFRLYLKDNGTGRRWKLWVCIGIVFFTGLPELGSADAKTYHLLASPLCWNSILLGQFGAFSYIVCRLGGIAAAKFLGPCLTDIGLVILGVLSGCAYYGLFAFASTTAVVFLVPVVGIFSVLPIGIVRSFNSKMVDKHELGAMFASIAWAELLSALVASISFNAVYQATVGWLTPFVFLLMIAADIIGLFLAVFLLFRVRREERSYRAVN